MTETIPEGWEEVNLKNIVKPVGKRNIRSNLPYLEIGDINIKNKRYLLKEKKAVVGAKIVHKNTILISRVRPTRGAITIVQEDELQISSALSSFEGVGIKNKFLFYCLTRKDFLKHMEKWETGSTYPSINERDIVRYSIKIPSNIQEQEKIASILSKVDEQIQFTEEIIEKTEQLKKGLMQELLTKGIGHTEFKETEILLKKHLISNEWNIVKLGQVATLKGRIGWQGLTTKEYLPLGDYNLITGTDFKNGKINWNTCVCVKQERYEQDKNIQLKNYDLLVTKDGTIGKIAIIENMPKKTTLNSGIFVIRPADNKFNPYYLYYILNSYYFEKFISILKAGSTIAHLYQRDFVKFEFPLPKLEEQNKIASILSSVDNQIQDNKIELERLNIVKKGLMQDLLTGKVRVKISG